MMRPQVILLLPLFGAPLACDDAPPPPAEVIRPVRVMEVLSTAAARNRKLSGTARAGVSSVLSFKVAGTVTDLEVKVGDAVDKGQIVARLEPSDFELQVAQARASLSQARAQARSARSTYDRVRALYENQNAPKSELDQARSARDTAVAQVDAVGKQLALSRRQLDYTTLRAPAKGRIASARIEVNENVSPGQPVVELSSGDRPEVLLQVPEMLIAQVPPKTKAKVSFDAMPDQVFGAEVTEVGVAPVGGATTFPVTLRLDAPSDAIRPGLAAEVELELAGEVIEGRFIVPPAAVGADHLGKFVFVAQASEEGLATVQRVAVEIGDLTTDGLEVLKGLEDGQLLVTAGVSRIRDGLKVRLPKKGS